MLDQMDPPEFDFANLSRVVPIGHSQAFDDCSIAVMSIELYRAGFIMILEFESLDRKSMTAMWTVNGASDDTGQRYIGWSRAGYGGGFPEVPAWNREVVAFTPSLNPHAKTLTVEIVLVNGTIGFQPGVGHFYPREAVIGGPWSVTVSLDSQPFSQIPPASARHVAHHPEYTFDRLQGVIPAPHQQTINEYTLTIYSLERYHDGFMLVMREDYPTYPGTAPKPPDWNCLDDLGNRYVASGRAGSGSLPLNRITTWRVDHHFQPAIDPLAKRLSLTMDTIGKVSGPWEFEVEL